MTNEQIAEYFSLTGKLMDIHGENSFKSKSYTNAAFQIDRLPEPLMEMPATTWAGLRGIGSSMASAIGELVSTGTLAVLDNLLAKTPEGIVEMMQIKGLGPKKIHTIWKEMEIESIGELLYACNENRLILYKGFGEKTQQQVRDAILFMMAQQGKFLYQQAEALLPAISGKLKALFGEHLMGICGEMRRKEDIISEMAFVITLPANQVRQMLEQEGIIPAVTHENTISFKTDNAPALLLYCCDPSVAGNTMLQYTGPAPFLEYIERKAPPSLLLTGYVTEEALFAAAGHAFVKPEHRAIAHDENYYGRMITQTHATPESIEGIIHCHSKWSDGSHSPEEMARAAQNAGFSYMVLSDHSQAAFYAGGLTPERVMQQHAEIDKLNEKFAPFKIFKSIECDILTNGSLDYDEETLSLFDLVIASVHSNLKMSEEKAMARLIAAIENPYTNILGHMTGRLLLSRSGYPVQHKKIIDACAANRVVIELNAHPRRLDIDWQWIPYALEKEVLISINPDAHSIEGFEDIRYGCMAASKAILPASCNLSSFSLQAFSDWLYENRRYKGTA